MAIFSRLSSFRILMNYSDEEIFKNRLAESVRNNLRKFQRVTPKVTPDESPPKFSRIPDYYLNEPRINCQHFSTLRRARSLVAFQIRKYFAGLHINYYTLVSCRSVHFQLSSRHVLSENYITHKYTLVYSFIFRTFIWNVSNALLMIKYSELQKRKKGPV